LSSKIKNIDEVASHNYGERNDRTFLWPKKIDSETINPKNFIELKKEFSLDELLIIDRLAGINDIVSIGNHVNRSGQNFLRRKTPEGKFPQFPDMSKIYNKINGLNTVVVHTTGEKRFKKRLSDEENIIWSEYIGLIAPVAHYVGIKVFAVGGNNLVNILKEL